MKLAHFGSPMMVAAAAVSRDKHEMLDAKPVMAGQSAMHQQSNSVRTFDRIRNGTTLSC